MKPNDEISEDNQQKQQTVSGHVEPVVRRKIAIKTEDVIKELKSQYNKAVDDCNLVGMMRIDSQIKRLLNGLAA